MRFPKIKKKKKFERTCYNCKYADLKCADRFKIDATNCNKFKFSSLCKST